MTNKQEMTYKAFSVDVGAERYWEEIKDFLLSSRLKNFAFGYIPYRGSEITRPSTLFDFVVRNHNHPVALRYGHLGVMVFGGFKDEKRFIAVLPSVNGFMVGDIVKNRYRCYNVMKIEGSYTSSSEGAYDQHYFGMVAENLDFNYENVQCSIEGNLIEEYAKTGTFENEWDKEFLNNL